MRLSDEAAALEPISTGIGPMDTISPCFGLRLIFVFRLLKISSNDLKYFNLIFKVMPEHVDICPYGDYYEPFETQYGDGEVQVFETFVNPLVLRDGSNRDTANENLEFVLNIRHDYDLDVEDIYQLLRFRIAMIPKRWTDQYGDIISKTAKEISECLNAITDDKAKYDGALRNGLIL